MATLEITFYGKEIYIKKNFLFFSSGDGYGWKKKKKFRKINYGRLFDKNTVSSKNFNFKTKANRTYHAAWKNFPSSIFFQNQQRRKLEFSFELQVRFWGRGRVKRPSTPFQCLQCYLILLSISVRSCFLYRTENPPPVNITSTVIR